ncbi:MAG: tetratricopeptide repeat protein [Burkholderiaceae bacterium]
MDEITGLLQEAGALEDKEPLRARDAAAKALALATNSRELKSAAEAYRRLGQVSWKLGQYKEAQAYLVEGYKLSRRIRDHRKQAGCVNSLGICYERTGNFEAALVCFEYFIELTNGELNPYAFNVATVNIGRLLEQTGNTLEAIALYEDAIAKLEARTPPPTADTMAMLYMNLGVCFCMQKRFEAAASLFERALDGFNESSPFDAAHCRANLAQTYAELRNFELANRVARKGLSQSRQLGSEALEIRLHLTMAEISLLEEKYKKALAWAKKALLLCKESTDIELNQSTHELLSRSYEALRNYRLSLKHHKIFSGLRASALKKFFRSESQQALQGSLAQLITLLRGRRSASTYQPRFSLQRSTPAESALDPNTRGHGIKVALSQREMEVLFLLAKGDGNSAIAKHLNISVYTARFHVSSIFNKLGVGKRSEAAAAAIRRGLLPL